MMFVVVLFVLISHLLAGDGSNSTMSYPHCENRCLEKISSQEICYKCCERLVNATNTGNNTPSYVPLIPNPPRLVSHTYTTITVQWLSRKQDQNKDIPVLYVLEIKREQVVNDSLIILPYVQRYHMVSNKVFTSSILEGKTNYQMRIAAISIFGTHGFSSFSPYYQTNKTCKVYKLKKNVTSPCPVTNLRLRVTADIYITRYTNLKQRTTSWLYWDSPPDIHLLPEDNLEIQIRLLSDSHACRNHGLNDRWSRYVSKMLNETRLEDQRHQRLLYMGCRYQVSVSRHNMMSGALYSTNANFSIPECIQGVCACTEDPPPKNGDPEDLPDSEHVTVSSYQPSRFNHTNITISWGNEPWRKKAVYFRVLFRLSVVMLITGNCEHPEQEIYLLNTTGFEHSKHDITIGKVHFKCKYYVVIEAYDSMACEVSPQQKLSIEMKIPTTESSITQSGNTSIITKRETTSSVPIALIGQRDKTKNSVTVAVTIIVPLVITLLIIVVMVLYVYKRRQGKQLMGQRSPTGLNRPSSENPNLESHIYHRNHDQDSALLSITENSRLLVNLPPKCANGGLEVNPAYFEQQIQEAIRLGETDDYEFGFHRLEIGRKLGKGAFGHVFIADAYGINGNPGKTVVAVKILKENASADEKDDFRAEINFMKMIGKHENVITILGCCTLHEPLCLIVEFAPHGDLLHYLRDLRKKFEQEKRRRFSLHPTVPDILATQYRSLNASPTATRASSTNDIRTKSLSISNFGQELWAIFSNQRRSSPKEFSSELYVGRNDESENPATSTQTVETTLTAGTTCQKQRSPNNKQTLISLDGALDSSELQSFAYQIACGMDYLSMKGVLHRDLAARNILVGEDKVLKISDFGLSREGVYVKRSTGKIPLRWLSVEAMRDRLYSTASDVWAFGIVLWEICTLGGFPYPTVNDRDLLKYLIDGNRMEKPSNCTDEIYNLMQACWSAEATERPSFQTVHDLLWDMQKSERPYVNVDPRQVTDLPPDEGHVAENLICFSETSSVIGCIANIEKDEENSDDEFNDSPPPQDFNDFNETSNNNNGHEDNKTQDFLLKSLNNTSLQCNSFGATDESAV